MYFRTDGVVQVVDCSLLNKKCVQCARSLKAMITLAIPFVILVIELAVSNAYLGILLASLPSVSLKYSNYLRLYL